MEISARSYLTAGISLTAAAAIAFTPLVVPANQQTVTIPNVTVSDIQLAVTPEDIEAFIANLQTALNDITDTVAEVIGIPGQTLVDVLNTAATLNSELWTALIGATDNPTIAALLTLLSTSSTAALTGLATTVDDANQVIVVTTADVATLLTSALTGSLQNALIAIVNVVNDPLNFANYAGLLTAGIASGQLLATNGLGVVSELGNAAFNLASIGITGVQDQINNAIGTVSLLLAGLGEASGSTIIQTVIGAVQGIVIAPATILTNFGFGVVTGALGVLGGGFNTVVNGAAAVVETIGDSLQAAVTIIGTAPLDPASYLAALGALLQGGFTGFDTVVTTVGAVAQIPFELATGLTVGLANTITSLNTAFAMTASGLLNALGLPANIVALPVNIANGLNNVINGVADVVVGGVDLASGLVAGGTNLVLEISESLQEAIFGPPPVVLSVDSAEPEATAFRFNSEGAGVESGGTPPVVPVSTDGDAQEPVDPPAEAPVDDTTPPAETPPADTSEEESDNRSEDTANDAKAERKAARAERKAEREAAKEERKAEREAAAAESEDKKQEKTEEKKDEAPAAADAAA